MTWRAMVLLILLSTAARAQVQDLGPLPPAAELRREFVSPDGRHVIWRVARPEGEAFVLDGRPDPTFAALKSDPLVSPDGRRLAYKVDAEDGAKRAVVLDGRPGPSFDQIDNDSLHFGADGRLGYSGQRHGHTAILREAEVLAEGPAVKSNGVFSPDGRRLAYKLDTGGGRRAVVLDGAQGPAWPQVDNSSLAFSRDSRHFVYVATNAEGHAPAQATVVCDGVAGETWERVEGLTFSPDGGHLAYLAWRGGQARVVLDGQAQPPCEEVDPYFLRFTAGGLLGYRAGLGSLVVGGREVLKAEGIADWAAGADGQPVAAVTRTGSAWSVLENGAKGEDFEAIAAPPSVSADGRHLAYAAARGGRWSVVVDGVAGGEWQRIGQPPVFSVDGGHLGCIARRDGRWFVVVDKAEFGPFEWFAWGSLKFSPDGRHWAAMVRSGEAWRVLLDGRPGPDCQRLFGTVPDFEPDGSLTYPAVREGRLVRINQTP
jgi:hypothetical protein